MNTCVMAIKGCGSFEKNPPMKTRKVLNSSSQRLFLIKSYENEKPSQVQTKGN